MVIKNVKPASKIVPPVRMEIPVPVVSKDSLIRLRMVLIIVRKSVSVEMVTL